MRLRSLTLEDFRQFYGMQKIEFAGSSDRNVTVVYGANGAGKTTLLNAFSWAFYKTFTDDFEEPERLVNERKWDETKLGTDVSARVVVVFEHENRTYTLTRVTTKTKAESLTAGNPAKDAVATLSVIDEDGRETTVGNPTDVVNQILPERLHRFFFFNGERIEKVVQPNAYAEIEQAIKTILGLEIIERAIKHLKDARSKLELELRLVGSPELERLSKELDALRARESGKRDEIKTAEENKFALEGELEAVNDKMRSLEDARQLQEKREQLEADFDANKSAISDVRKGIAGVITADGYMAFLSRPAREAELLLEESREKGEIPTPIKRQFVEDLLTRGECICGEPLVDGHDRYTRVAAWKARAGSAHVEEVGSQLAASAKFMQSARSSFFQAIADREKQLLHLRAQNKTLEEELSEIHRQLGDKESEEIQTLEVRRDDLRSSIDQYNIKLGGLLKELADIEDDIEAREKSMETAEAQSKKAEIAQRRVKAASEARQLFTQVLKLRTEDVREQLDQRIKTIYRKISFKTYTPSLTERFRLELRNPQNELVPKSTGENQILSLAFVGALAALARDRYDEVVEDGKTASLLSFRGGIYPIIMDSAFGNLDENYRSQVARSMPQLAPQVAMFVSKAQGQGPVESEMSSRIAKSYVLNFFTPKEDFQNETISVDGRALPYITKSNETAEWVQLAEV